MAQCNAIKANGERCRVEAMPGATYCWGHDPTYADERQRNASKGGKQGGRGRHNVSTELTEIKGVLTKLADDVLAGTIDRGAAIAANLILNTRLRAIEIERKIKETEELETRLEALEEVSTATRWG